MLAYNYPTSDFLGLINKVYDCSHSVPLIQRDVITIYRWTE